jgi:hypothetical protein
MGSTRCRRRAFGAMLLMAIVLGLGFSGCATWEIEPPPPGRIAEPAEVWLTRYARHVRLTLPAEDGRTAVEYGYGDWHWYAEGEVGALSGLRALFWPSDAALSRGEFRWGPDAATIASRRGDRALAITVERARLQALREDLEALWESLDEAETVRHGAAVYRRMGASYHFFNNSTTKTAEWLRALDCRVARPSIGGDFVLREAE